MFKWISKEKREREKREREKREFARGLRIKEEAELRKLRNLQENNFVNKYKNFTLQEMIDDNSFIFGKREGNLNSKTQKEKVKDYFWRNIGKLHYKSKGDGLGNRLGIADNLMLLEKRIEELEKQLETIETENREQTERE